MNFGGLIQRADRAASRDPASPTDGFRAADACSRSGVAGTNGSSPEAWGWSSVSRRSSRGRASCARVSARSLVRHLQCRLRRAPSRSVGLEAGGGSSTAAQVYRASIPDGTTVQLTYGPDSNRLNAWSPDGSQILVARTFADGSGTDLFAVRVDDSSETRLTTNPQVEEDAQWSPGGSRIAFRSGGGISVMNADGTEVQRLASQTNDSVRHLHLVSRMANASRSSTWGRSAFGDRCCRRRWNDTRSSLRRPDPPIEYSPARVVPGRVEDRVRRRSRDIRRRSTSWMRTGTNVVRLSSIQAGRPTWSPDGSGSPSKEAGGVYVIDVVEWEQRIIVTGSGYGHRQLVTRWIDARDLRQRRHRGHEGRLARIASGSPTPMRKRRARYGKQTNHEGARDVLQTPHSSHSSRSSNASHTQGVCPGKTAGVRSPARPTRRALTWG